MEVIKWRLRWTVEGSERPEMKLFLTEEALQEFKSDLEFSAVANVSDFIIDRVKIKSKK